MTCYSATQPLHPHYCRPVTPLCTLLLESNLLVVLYSVHSANFFQLSICFNYPAQKTFTPRQTCCSLKLYDNLLFYLSRYMITLFCLVLSETVFPIFSGNSFQLSICCCILECNTEPALQAKAAAL